MEKSFISSMLTEIELLLLKLLKGQHSLRIFDIDDHMTKRMEWMNGEHYNCWLHNFDCKKKWKNDYFYIISFWIICAISYRLICSVGSFSVRLIISYEIFPMKDTK